MTWVASSVKGIMLVSGLLTCTMLDARGVAIAVDAVAAALCVVALAAERNR